MSQPVEPSIDETAFSCPHCNAYTTQYWYQLYAKPVDSETRTPYFPTEENLSHILQDDDFPGDQKKFFIDWMERLLTGLVYFRKVGDSQGRYEVENLHVSKCYNCNKLSVWLHKSLIFPCKKSGELANPDLPGHILRDYEEARSIIEISPRGAAALLRLCIQKLCIHLGLPGKKIDKDIGALVEKGLNPLVQKSLDVVRVIGNESVHPGKLDITDDRDTAIRLLGLINLITEQLISQPGRVDEMYKQLPESKLEAIDKRDGKE